MPCDPTGITVEIDHIKMFGKSPSMLKLHKTLLNALQIKEDGRIRKSLELTERENVTCGTVGSHWNGKDWEMDGLNGNRWVPVRTTCVCQRHSGRDLQTAGEGL